MLKKDIKIQINEILWKKALGKIKSDFVKKYTQTDCLLIIMLLALYKSKNKLRNIDNTYLALDTPEQLSSSHITSMTISVYYELLKNLQNSHLKFTYSQLMESAIADYIVLPKTFYTDCISSLYTIVGSKNHTMQNAIASIVENMNLSHESFTLIDGCCATDSLYFGLKDYPWKSVILNDLNPLRTNFLNVIKREPMKLIKKLLETDFSFIDTPDTKNPIIKKYKKELSFYEEKRKHYHHVDCNLDIAYMMFIVQCISKAYIENSDRIFERILRFLPAHLKIRLYNKCWGI